VTEARPWRELAAERRLAVLLIRHGRTELNAQRRFCGGRSDPSLDVRGREQVAELGRRFVGEIEAVFCSPQRRALETAAVLGPEPVVLEALRELDQGSLEGREIHPALREHADFFAAWKRNPTHVPIPGGGESMSTLADRVAGAMDEVLARLGGAGAGRVIAVVGHQMAHAAFVCRALGEPLGNWPRFELRNAGANLLAFDGQRWSLAARNL
jgi:broad specificity phosphatase PhoE